jgi:hypothetical protein
MHYDVTRHGKSMAKYASRIVELAEYHDKFFGFEDLRGQWNLQGKLTKQTTLFVGERLSVSRPEGCDWPFFAGLIDDIEMRLARADMEIAAHYERLYSGEVERYAGPIREEYELTRRLVLQLVQRTFAGFRHQHAMPRLGQRVEEQPKIRGYVVDNQDAGLWSIKLWSVMMSVSGRLR